ncbi:MAG: ankyrin repeat domain-containing protein [bacterium]
MKIIILLALLIANINAQQIHEAVKTGNLEQVKTIISSDSSQVNLPDGNGNTPIILAVQNGKINIAQILIQNKADLNLKNNYGFTPLHIAADQNQIEIGKILVESGGDLNALSRYQTTPIFNAVEKGNLGFVEMLIHKGADINFNSPIFGCPIHRAVYRDNPDILKLLVSNFAQVEVVDPNGRTPLMLCGLLGRYEEAEVLLNNNAKINSVDQIGMNALHNSIRYGTDRSGKNNSFKLTELLLKNDADANSATLDGQTPASLAVAQGYSDVLKLLHKNNAKLNFVDKNYARTLLHIAAIKGYGEIVEYLIANGLDKSQRDSEGKIACDYALKYGNDKIAVTLSGNQKIVDQSENALKYLHQNISGGETFVWLMNQRGWAVKTKSHLFVFDNEELGRKPDQPSLSNGWIAASEIKVMDVVALYSAYHALPNTMEFIHSIEDSLTDVVYIHYKEDEWRGGKNSKYISGREIQQYKNVQIIPYETHDDYGMGSLGYLIKADALTIFYPNFFPEDIEQFKTEIDFLASQTDKCDIAIIEVAQDRENVYAEYIIEKLNPALIIPYDRSGDSAQYPLFKAEMLNKHPQVKIDCAKLPGDRIEYQRIIK